jgi:hypothetical protein
MVRQNAKRHRRIIVRLHHDHPEVGLQRNGRRDDVYCGIRTTPRIGEEHFAEPALVALKCLLAFKTSRLHAERSHRRVITRQLRLRHELQQRYGLRAAA